MYLASSLIHSSFNLCPAPFGKGSLHGAVLKLVLTLENFMVVLKFALYTLIKCDSALQRFQQFLLDIAVVISLNYNAIPRSLLAVP